MTLEEAKAVALVITTADGGCANCLYSLAGKLNAACLGFLFEVKANEPFTLCCDCDGGCEKCQWNQSIVNPDKVRVSPIK